MAKQENKKLTKKSKYLVCVDAYNYSRMAVLFACRVAKNNGCPIEILHVIEPADFQGLGAVADKMREEKRQETEKLLEKYATEVQKTSGITPSLAIREGDIEEEIVKAVEGDKEINMLILGTSPDSGGRSKVLPELISQLYKKLAIPVILVPGNITESQVAELT